MKLAKTLFIEAIPHINKSISATYVNSKALQIEMLLLQIKKNYQLQKCCNDYEKQLHEQDRCIRFHLLLFCDI